MLQQLLFVLLNYWLYNTLVDFKQVEFIVYAIISYNFLIKQQVCSSS